jgi:hypothetical protein
MRSRTLPGPVPDIGETATHDGGVLTVHAQPVNVLTPNSALLPSVGIPTLAGVTVNVHGDGAWVTTNWEPLMAMFPVRAVPWGLAVPLRAIDVSPWPDGGDIWIQGELLVAVHAHSRSVITPTSTLPPPAGIVGTLARVV